MPLVTFKRSANSTQNSTVSLTGPLEDFRQTVNLPRELYNKRWFLRSVNMLYRSANSDILRYMEIRLPQLMPEDKTMFFLKSEGSTPEPKRSLRFYPNKYGMDQRVAISSTICISVSPNLDLGTHRLDQLHLDLFVTAKDQADVSIGVTTYEVILEYI